MQVFKLAWKTADAFLWILGYLGRAHIEHNIIRAGGKSGDTCLIIAGCSASKLRRPQQRINTFWQQVASGEMVNPVENCVISPAEGPVTQIGVQRCCCGYKAKSSERPCSVIIIIIIIIRIYRYASRC